MVNIQKNVIFERGYFVLDIVLIFSELIPVSFAMKLLIVFDVIISFSLKIVLIVVILIFFGLVLTVQIVLDVQIFQKKNFVFLMNNSPKKTIFVV